MNQLDRFLSEIEIAIREGAPLPALALALALPDICSTLEFTDSKQSTTPTTFDTWCRTHLPHLHIFAPEHVYPLRCAFLHNGSTDVSRHAARGNLRQYKLSMENRGVTLRLRIRDEKTGEEIYDVSTPLRDLCRWLIGGVHHWQMAHSSNPTVQLNLSRLTDP